MDQMLVLGLSITVIFFFAMISYRLRWPLVLGVLVAGMLVGPASPLAGVKLGPIDISMFIIPASETSTIEIPAALRRP